MSWAVVIRGYSKVSFRANGCQRSYTCSCEEPFTGTASWKTLIFLSLALHRKPKENTHTPPLNTTSSLSLSLSLSEGVGCGEDFVYPCGTEADECSEWMNSWNCSLWNRTTSTFRGGERKKEREKVAIISQ